MNQPVPEPVCARPGLPDSTVFIAGGTRGLGLEIARHLVRSGTQRIGLIARDATAGERAAEEVRSLASGIWALFAGADLTRAADVERAVAELAASIGDPDVVIACTTAVSAGARSDGLANVCRAVIGPMTRQGGGVIVNVAAAAPERPSPGVVGSTDVATAEGAHCRTLAEEVRSQGIRVEEVRPSWRPGGHHEDLVAAAAMVLTSVDSGTPR